MYGQWQYGKWAKTDRMCQDLTLFWAVLIDTQRMIWVRLLSFLELWNAYGRNFSPVHHRALSLTTKASAGWNSPQNQQSFFLNQGFLQILKTFTNQRMSPCCSSNDVWILKPSWIYVHCTMCCLLNRNSSGLLAPGDILKNPPKYVGKTFFF